MRTDRREGKGKRREVWRSNTRKGRRKEGRKRMEREDHEKENINVKGREGKGE